MQSEKAPMFQSAGADSARIKRCKQYLSPLRLSLRDLIAAGADNACIIINAERDSVNVVMQVQIPFIFCGFWMLLLKDK